MALDGLVIHSIVNELSSKLIGGKIDKIYQPEIEFCETYSSAEFINCEGKLEGNKVIISSTLYAYEFCFVCLKK